MDTKSLIERLRKGQLSYRLDSGGVYHGGDALHMEAADALASQAAEIERLRGALQALTTKLAVVHDDHRYARVWEIAQMAQGPYAGPTYIDELADARAALNGEKP